MAMTTAPVANADNGQMIECSNHTHVWHQQDCPQQDDNGPFGFPGTSGHGGGGGGGLLGLLGSLL
jgi:hypothetical protein